MAKENLENKSQLGRVRKLTPKENKQMIEHNKQVLEMPDFRELEKWRADSLHSSMTINSVCHSPPYVPTPVYGRSSYSF